MEHLYNTEAISDRTGITDTSSIELLVKYAQTIHSENKKYNLTGHKTMKEIIESLIVGSLEPVRLLNVPRGTLFADIGTGAGIPGIPLAIKYKDSSATLIDSNQKKIRFINKYISNFKISNASAVDIRVEDACGASEYRNHFDIVFTRAMSDIYTVAELAAPLLKPGGYICLYINKDQSVITDYLSSHLNDLGLSDKIMSQTGFITDSSLFDGLILSKIKDTPEKFPRRMAVINRMSLRNA